MDRLARRTQVVHRAISNRSSGSGTPPSSLDDCCTFTSDPYTEGVKVTSHAFDPTISSVEPCARLVCADGIMRCRQLEISDAGRADETWITGFDARNSGPLVELQAARAAALAAMANKWANRGKVVTLRQV
ncbi:hypothetical protein [Caballeronia sp. LZ043]|uniref:hypothetical protein n=1 Tax=Caballeronia sp. LZ043 TaxID=3038569 RepID=UPI0028562997|nr:hypothetical protein [Caballeronia sp. LZ043]MDR5819538.1 hypothetical protein [Caballeronia sp. LZ043]